MLHIAHHRYSQFYDSGFFRCYLSQSIVLRTLLGQVLTLRHILVLDFVPDRSVDYEERINGILHRLGLDSLPGQGAEGRSEGETDD